MAGDRVEKVSVTVTPEVVKYCRILTPEAFAKATENGIVPEGASLCGVKRTCTTSPGQTVVSGASSRVGEGSTVRKMLSLISSVQLVCRMTTLYHPPPLPRGTKAYGSAVVAVKPFGPDHSYCHISPMAKAWICSVEPSQAVVSVNPPSNHNFCRPAIATGWKLTWK